MSGAVDSTFTACLLSIFISVGVTLECQICETTGRNCHGPKQTCPPDYDRCGIILLDRSFGINKQTTVKKCAQHRDCDKGLAVFNMGKGRTVLGNLSCCVGECKSTSPLPSRKTTLSGYKCPASYSLQNVNREETVECAVGELYCAELFQTPNTDCWIQDFQATSDPRRTLRIMETPLAICLLSIFIVTGASLECEVCEKFEHTCNGTFQTCSSGYDRCGIVLSENTLGIKVKAIIKSCLPHSACSNDYTVINMGQAGRVVSQAFCCTGDECRTMTPTLKPRSNIPNGKFCPACYAVHHAKCEQEETIECTGDEDYCFDGSGTTQAGEVVFEIQMKGCINKAACYEAQDYSTSFSGMNVVASRKCMPASRKSMRHSGCSRITPASFGLFLLPLAGLLLVKYLP
ncbi:uncharacterized protein LOC133370869 [Rhineura floridana]|uniref:uncharacterized protein LOC133370869 n=1 Tax=Rhineura floridana TaxID=261503 RepID=UPI002AC88136|nr:uncharacterized protein LOC133370869 [Rhineura floridana]